MRLLANWRDVLKRAWSIRLLVLAGVLSGLEVALPLFGWETAWWFAPLSLAVVAAAFVSRLIAQKGLSDD
jgi:hypothetical protein